MAGAGGEVHDQSTAPLAHVRGELLREREDRVHVELHRVPPVVEAHLPERLEHGLADVGGVVDEDVDRPERPERLLDEPGDVGLHQQVRLDREPPAPGLLDGLDGLPDRAGDVVPPDVGARRHDHTGPQLRKLDRGRPTHAPTGPRHDGNLPL